MKVTREMTEQLGDLLKEHQEAEIIALLAQKLDINAAEAMRVFYESDIAREINAGEYGAQYLSAEYLVDEVIKEYERRNLGLYH